MAAKKLIKPHIRSKKAASVSRTDPSTTKYPHSFLYSGSDTLILGYLGTEKQHLFAKAVIKMAENSAIMVEISTATAANGNADAACNET